MNLPDIDSGPEGSNSALPPSSFNPLLEAVLKSRSSQVNNVTSASLFSSSRLISVFSQE